jgi:RNA polymerase sigma-70 factor (ECF subfamily)
VDAQLEKLISLHADRAFAIARRMVGNDADAGDVVQEAFLRVMRYLRTYDPSQPFEAWLAQIIRNVYLRSLRVEARRRSVPLSEGAGEDSLALEEVLADPEPGPQEAVEAAERRDQVQEALQALSAPLRMAVILVDLEGMEREEAARALECSLSALDVRLHRARARLRELLAGTRGGRS